MSPWVPAAVAALFVLVRVAYLLAVPGSWYVHEEVSPARESYEGKVLLFEEAARNILEGRGCVVRARHLDEDVSLLLEYPPGFPLLIAALSLAGAYSHPVMQWLQIGMALLTLALLCGIARAIASPRAAVIAAVLIAASPVLARSDVAIDACVPAVLMVSAVLSLVLRDGGSPGVRWAVAGALMGVTALLFPDFTGLPAFLLLAVAAARGLRYLARYGTLFLLLYLAGVLPLAAMYRRELGAAALSPPVVGTSMMRGLGQFGGTGERYMPTTQREVMEYEGFFRPGEGLTRWAGEEILMYYPRTLERDRARRAAVARFVRAHPGFVARGMARKFPRMFAGNITGVTPAALDARADALESASPRTLRRGAGAFLCRAAAWFFRRFRWVERAAACMAAAGVVLAVRRSREALLVAAVPLYLAAAHLPFFFEPRMMTPALPFILVFAAVFLDRIAGGRAAPGGAP